MYIVIIGNVVDGLTFFGTFKKIDQAIEYAERELNDVEWAIAPIEKVK